MARFRRTTSKGNTYLQLVASYRNENRQPATRVLANLGNISTLSEQQIERLTTSFIKAVGMEDKFQMNNFTAGKGYHYGSCLPVIALWQQLNLTGIINHALSEKVKIAVAPISLIQTANRFSDPGSKLACYRWYENSVFSQLKNFVNFPDEEQEKLHTYYRSLDYLYSLKADIERQLYYHFHSYRQDNSLILYDLTSVYFEGEQAALAVPGYSRDRRPDADQIVIGIVINGEGIPIAHHIFAGNTVDKTTVADTVADLAKRFSITRVIFVGDRGLLTSSNLEAVKSHGCQYIMGMQRRQRRIISYLLETVSFSQQELASDEIIIKEASYADLSQSLQQDYDANVRFIICYNKQMANQKKQRRDKNLTKFSALLNQTQQQGVLKQLQESHHKLKSFLAKYKMTKFYQLEIENISSTTEPSYQLNVTQNDEVLSLEQRLDGKFFIQTEVGRDQLDKQRVVSSYKSLQKVERAFRVIKDELDIRPIYVRKETRIRGHVMICYLSLLMEILMEKKLAELFPVMTNSEHNKQMLRKSQRTEADGYTMTTLREELDTIRLVPLYINGQDKPRYISTSIGNDMKQFFSSLGIVNASDPQYLRVQRPKPTRNNNQLDLSLGC